MRERLLERRLGFLPSLEMRVGHPHVVQHEADVLIATARGAIGLEAGPVVRERRLQIPAHVRDDAEVLMDHRQQMVVIRAKRDLTGVLVQRLGALEIAALPVRHRCQVDRVCNAGLLTQGRRDGLRSGGAV